MTNVLVDGIFHEERLVPASGIAYLAAHLRKRGFSVKLFAPNNLRMNEEQTATWLLKQRSKFIGVSLLTRFTFPSFRKLAYFLRAGGYTGFLCVGGYEASSVYKQLLDESPGLDCVIVGYGEETCAELLECLQSSRDWRNLAGLARRVAGGEAKYNGPRPIKSPDEYPLIAVDLIEELVDSYGASVRIDLVTSRGCYADCSYCSVKTFTRLQNAQPYQMRSVSTVVDEIEMIQQRLNVTHFCFTDDNFLVPGRSGIRKAKEFSKLIKERGLKLHLTLRTRPECVTYEAISLLKEAGLCDIFIGTESFDQGTLDLYHRNNTVEQSLHALDVFESLGFSASVDAQLRVRVGSMIFHPYVTLEALYKQARHFRKYRISAKNLVKHLYRVPGARLCRQLEQEGLLNKDGEYNYVHPEVSKVYHTLRKFYSEYMSVREDIRTIEKNVACTSCYLTLVVSEKFALIWITAL